MSQENENLSPLDKLEALKEKIKAKSDEGKQQKQDERVEELKAELDSERVYNDNRAKKNNEDTARINELTAELKGQFTERDRLKNEGKKAAAELRKTKEGQEIIDDKKDNEFKQEIFGDTINALKDIQEFVKKHKKEFDTEIEERKNNISLGDKANQETKTRRIKEFKEKYPEIDDIHKKMGYMKERRDWLVKEKESLRSFLSSPEFTLFLEDKLVHKKNEYNRDVLVDVTLEEEIKNLRTQLDGMRKEVHDKYEEIRKKEQKGKSWLEDKKGFDEKISNLFAELKKYEKEQEGIIFHGDRGIQNLVSIKQEIEDKLSGFLRVNFNSIEEREAVEKGKTIRGLVEHILSVVEKEIEEKKLSEEEQLIKDLNDELWR